jgi:HPt (histidine-containing phosphotransfer) domain-containing protein
MTARVDPVLIGHLARLPGAEGQDLGTELVGRFAETLVTLLPRLRTLAATGDASTLALDSHSLRGSAALLGALTLAQLAKSIENDARAGELARAASLVDALEAEWVLTQPELRSACIAAAAAATAMRTGRITPLPARPAD